VLENRVLRRIFALKRDKETGGENFRKRTFANIIKMIDSRRMR
jgi:hypothetical protein